MATKLTHITGQYHSYVNDQLLTHLQLNETIDFFEDQNRMHNVYLHGTGIACGFATSFTENSGGIIESITIKQGTGITTDGDVIKLKTNYTNAELTTELIETKQKLCTVNFDEIIYKSFKKFDVDKGNYARFIDASDPSSLIPIWEIFPEKTTALESGEQLLTNFSGNLNEYVILLYLENYTKPKALCSATDCSNLGGEEVFNLRVLVVDKTNADIIKADDTIFNKYDYYESYAALPELNVKKVPLTSANSANKAKLKEYFFTVVDDVAFKTQLTNGITTILSTFNYTSQLTTITNGFTTLFTIDPAIIGDDIFYRYDALKDITATYMELKDLFIQLCCECNPDIEAFPKHLFLGLVEDSNQYKSYRHKFYKASYLDNHNETYNRFDSLVQRLASLFAIYSAEFYEMKITPSPFYGKLGAKSIPFYYAVDETLLNYWDFDKTVIYNQKANFSYHTSELKTDDYIQNTLVYCLTDKNFFRIEGYTKSASTDIETFLKSKKGAYGLDFDYLILDVISDRTQLDYLIEQNPSFEHLCGVKKGGTLLILKEGDAIVTDFCIENRTVLLEEIIEEPCGCSIADCFSFMKPSIFGSKTTAKGDSISTVKPKTNYNCLFIRWVTLMLLWLTIAMLLCCKKCSCSNKEKGYNTTTITTVIKKEPLL